MNYFFMPATQLMSAAEGAGGLFDFNATLPLMAIQFILLTVALTFVFYKPVAKVLDERENYINSNLTQASEKLLTADELYKQYDEQLKSARVNAQSIVAQAEKVAKDAVAEEIAEARSDAAKLIEQTNTELEVQKSRAIEKLETQVDELSQLIKKKVLGEKILQKFEDGFTII
jgi:F-type H+-transporting ATPase subunit b